MLPCACSSNWKDYTEPGDRILVLVDVYIPEMGKEAVTTGKKCQIEYVYASVSSLSFARHALLATGTCPGLQWRRAQSLTSVGTRLGGGSRQPSIGTDSDSFVQRQVTPFLLKRINELTGGERIP